MISDKPLNTDMNVAVKDLSATAPRNRASDQPQSSDTQALTRSESKTVEASVPVPSQETAKEAKLQAEKEIEQVQKDELKKSVNEAIPKVRELLQKNQRSLNFKVAEEENRIVITVIDEETDTIIRQIPPEDVLKIAASIEQGLELGGGSILSDKA
jgi:flagellar protein FlaG